MAAKSNKPDPWDRTITINNDVANAPNEINRALGQGSRSLHLSRE